MELERGKLSNVVQVTAGNTSAIVTVSNNKKIYVKSIIAHGVNVQVTPTAQVYYVPNGSSVGASTRIFDVTLSAKESALIEPAYPIVLTQTGDALYVGAGVDTVNFLVTGDKEA
jgi:hypothetical protein|tara:strand:+ start:114 stop:455 length:342 start_codon:yes stop_codon:yes gene_type:complete